MSFDRWGTPTAASAATSVAAWNRAWEQALHFVDDPFVTLADANENDPDFALGSVFCGAYRMLGGLSGTSTEVMAEIATVEERAEDARERGHLAALQDLAAGNFTAAAHKWDHVATEHSDFAAVRFAHDVYLHVGDSNGRMSSSSAAREIFDGQPGWNFVASQYAFALEEVGRFDEAERVAFEALDADPMDLWATHALAHVHEHTDNRTKMLSVLRERQPMWEQQSGLAVHIWWHFTLSLIALGELDEVLSIHDRLVPDATTPYRLSDLASMLWRVELAGGSVGDRWDNLADGFAARPERHTAGFLDLHMALVYSRRPDHPEAAPFFQDLRCAHGDESSENSDIFNLVVEPLVRAIRESDADPAAAIKAIDSLESTLHRVGGSNAQREIVGLTRSNLQATQQTAPEAT